METAWLIERSAHGATEWLMAPDVWTTDANKAAKFSLSYIAAGVIRRFKLQAVATEHAWPEGFGGAAVFGFQSPEWKRHDIVWIVADLLASEVKAEDAPASAQTHFYSAVRGLAQFVDCRELCPEFREIISDAFLAEPKK